MSRFAQGILGILGSVKMEGDPERKFAFRASPGLAVTVNSKEARKKARPSASCGRVFHDRGGPSSNRHRSESIERDLAGLLQMHGVFAAWLKQVLSDTMNR
jgi:hypothetical protein